MANPPPLSRSLARSCASPLTRREIERDLCPESRSSPVFTSPARPRLLPSAFCLLSLLASFAPAQGESFLQRMERWERETGQRSRMTHYARLDSLGLQLPDMASNSAIDAILNDPAGADLAKVAAFAQTWQPALDLLTSAWSAPLSATVEKESIFDPVPDVIPVFVSTRLLCCRAHAYARRGDSDAALADISSVWLVGSTFERSELEPFVTVTGYRVRLIALLALRQTLERFELSDDQLSKLLFVFARESSLPLRVESILQKDHALDRNYWISSFPRMAQSLEQSYQQLHSSYSRLASSQTRAIRPALEAHRDEVRRIVANCQIFEVAEIAERILDATQVKLVKMVADAREQVLITAIATILANRRAGGIATTGQIAAAAGNLRDCLIDPFTGDPLLIVNRGGSEVAVISAGPDGVAPATGPWTLFDPKNLWDDPGDIFFSRLK